MKIDDKNSILNANIDELGIPDYIAVLLKYEYIDTVDELIKYSKEELLHILKDEKRLLELEAVLKNNGFIYVSNYGVGEWIYDGNENYLGD